MLFFFLTEMTAIVRVAVKAAVRKAMKTGGRSSNGDAGIRNG